MTVLSVNLNKIALLRNARGADVPSVTGAAATVIAAGARGITVHPRPDQRHIRPDDVTALHLFLADQPDIEYNIEGNPFSGPRDNGYPGFDAFIEQTRPAQATLVPDTDNQLTSDHGFDLLGDNQALREKIALLQSFGARVSLFMDPDLEQIDQAKAIGADRIELYTGPFADTVLTHGADSEAARQSLALFKAGADHADAIGLGVNAGHDLDLPNLPLFAHIGVVAEVSIGHALIARALERGLTQTVQDFLAAMDPTAAPSATS
ncbi:MAG: pyridoxine 5'-phosphate synthase [Pseudomonadales bacterium]